MFSALLGLLYGSTILVQFAYIIFHLYLFLLVRYGSLKFEVSNIPYEDLYFSSINSTHIVSLQDYIKTFKNSSTHPVYLFDGKTISQYPKLAADIYIPKWLNPSSIYLKQFILGPRNSGSPPHFHGQAVNALIYGIKEWYFWKPVNAFFSFSHIMDLKDKASPLFGYELYFILRGYVF